LAPLVLIALVLTSASAMGASQLKPTAKDRTDAGAFIAAAKEAYKTGVAAVATLPNVAHATDSTCGGAVGAAFEHASTDPTTFEAIEGDAYDLLLLRVLAPTVVQYGRDLQAVRAHDPVLRRYVDYITTTTTPRVERYAAAPSFDLCKLFRDWEASGFKPGFDWVSDAHVSRGLADRVEGDFATLGTPPTLYNPIGNRLVAFGVRSSVAFWFPNALYHAAGQ